MEQGPDQPQNHTTTPQNQVKNSREKRPMSPSTVFSYPESCSDYSPLLTPSVMSPEPNWVQKREIKVEIHEENNTERLESSKDTPDDHSTGWSSPKMPGRGAPASLKTNIECSLQLSGILLQSSQPESVNMPDATSREGEQQMLAAQKLTKWHSYSFVEIEEELKSFEQDEEPPPHQHGTPDADVSFQEETWSDFDKYGIDIDLFVGSSRMATPGTLKQPSFQTSPPIKSSFNPRSIHLSMDTNIMKQKSSFGNSTPDSSDLEAGQTWFTRSHTLGGDEMMSCYSAGVSRQNSFRSEPSNLPTNLGSPLQSLDGQEESMAQHPKPPLSMQTRRLSRARAFNSRTLEMRSQLPQTPDKASNRQGFSPGKLLKDQPNQATKVEVNKKPKKGMVKTLKRWLSGPLEIPNDNVPE